MYVCMCIYMYIYIYICIYMVVWPFAAAIFANFAFSQVLQLKIAKKRCCKFAPSLFGLGQSK